jgi:cytochrome oxidase Cu insertion factor (SCO1/SenC/PrrC family)
MRRLATTPPLLLVLLATLLYGCQWTPSRKATTAVPLPAPHPGVEVGQVAPDIEGEDLDGQHLHLADYRGQVVVLSFWSNS